MLSRCGVSCTWPNISEVELAGGLRGAPVDLVKCETVPLEVPASSEIVIEGWALDPQAAIGSGIEAIHVWAQRTDVAAQPEFLGAAGEAA